MTQETRPLLPYLYPALFLAVVATHVWLCWRVGEVHPVPNYDEAVYADLAREMVRTGAPMRRLGEEPRFYYIHPYLQTFFWSLPLHGSVPEEGLQNPDQAIKLLSRLRWVTTIFSVGTLCFIFAMFAKNAPGFGLLASALLAFNPMWLKYSHLVYLEVPCAFWVMAAAFFFNGPVRNEFKVDQQDVRFLSPLLRAWGFGIALGAATITKYLAILFLPCPLIIRITPKKRLIKPMAIGFVLVFLSWPLYILMFGDLGQWVSRSFGRMGSFQSGQGGDPRTDWGVIGLLTETASQLGPVYSCLSLLGIASFPIVVLWYALHAIWILKKSDYKSKQVFKRLRESDRWPSLMSVGFGVWVIVYVVAWLVLPTKDPKFLVIALPLVMVSGTSVLFLIAKDIFDRNVFGSWMSPLLVVAILLLFLLAFPIDLLGLDNTRFKKLYPTDHAYTHVALPHGQDYRPIAESIFLRTKPGEVIPVGRQGPIVGYLADRPYQILYTEDDPLAFEKRLETSRYLVIDDSWQNCFAGVHPLEVDRIRRGISQDYEIAKEVGHVKLLVKK
ncbi:MAG: phospholipid carrier-dependent glycosyltransferase [Candidatus Omnitrophica bacterium]|nr:phospholipid carrier-dependent glycosyltransferase [Candidatus Omnitrophota bacterium]